ncbi:hypothetical protein K3495_g12322 [Podosphaera aphanis]|nr:hypothetical protein K3495_g12322 [Podosphaera aphanis]
MSLNYRHPTVYDAVAGRISVTGFIPQQAYVSSHRDTASSSRVALSPESVLFRSKKAPTRFAECDIYFTNERCDVSDLPSSDLLKTLHAYISDFYFKATANAGVHDWKSLDETALIAFGILMEELALDILGKTGDLALTEGEQLVSMEEESRPESKVTSPEPPMKKRKTDR